MASVRRHFDDMCSLGSFFSKTKMQLLSKIVEIVFKVYLSFSIVLCIFTKRQKKKLHDFPFAFPQHTGYPETTNETDNNKRG